MKLAQRNMSESFLAGFEAYAETGIELTNAEISDLFPEMEITAFVQGMTDAINDDYYRYDLTRYPK